MFVTAAGWWDLLVRLPVLPQRTSSGGPSMSVARNTGKMRGRPFPRFGFLPTGAQEHGDIPRAFNSMVRFKMNSLDQITEHYLYRLKTFFKQ